MLKCKKHLIAVGAMLLVAGSCVYAASEEGAQGLPLTPVVPSVSVGPASDGKPAASSLPASSTAHEDMPTWLLPPEVHPAVLHLSSGAPVTPLMLSVPEVADARLMLPGAALDEAAAVRASISRYVTSTVSRAVETRSQQLEAVTRWTEQARQQKKLVPQDEWAAYEFNVEARAQLDPVLLQLKNQAGQGTAQLTAVLQKAVATLTPLIAVMPTYESRIAWYNLQVQLKEALDLYNAEVLPLEKKLKDTVESFDVENPALTRPVSALPAKDGLSAGNATTAAKVAPEAVAIKKDLKPAASSPAATTANQGSGVFGGLLVAGFIAVTFVGLFVMLRKRKKAVSSSAAA